MRASPAAAALAAAALLIILAHSAKDLLIATFVTRVEDTSGVQLDLGVVTFTWSTLRVEAGPIVATGSDGSTLFTAQALRFEVTPRFLLSRSIAFSEVELARPPQCQRSCRIASAELTV